MFSMKLRTIFACFTEWVLNFKFTNISATQYFVGLRQKKIISLQAQRKRSIIYAGTSSVVYLLRCN